MGQAGAQREPSMEEILASIRKIIENNDAADDPAGGAGLPPAHAEDEDVAAAVPEAASAAYDAEIDRRPFAFPARSGEPAAKSAFGSAERAPAEAPKPAAAPAAAAAGSTAAAVATATVAEAEEADEADGEEEAQTFSLADVAARMRSQGAPAAGTVLDDQAVGALDFQLEDERAFAGDAEPAPASAEDGSAEEAAEEKSAAPTEHDAQGKGQLISLDAGAKVAESFAVLNAAVAAGHQRSFDEIAEELLRPMLQAWLDDNLPTLVERLVREEIERVSRGTRR